MNNEDLSRVLSPGGRERPFYFNVVVWGEGFRKYFLEYCLPSLLSPRNIPALPQTRGNKFLIATHTDDWAILSAAPIFTRLAQYVEPVFVELPAAPPGGPETDFNGLGYNLGLMGVGHQLVGAMSFRDRAYAIYLAPDSMLSDGSVQNLDKHARNGVELVQCAALRLAEEPLFEGLARQGIDLEASNMASGMPLTISGRQIIRASLNGLHSETMTYEWDARYFFARRPSAVWWRVPGEEGILVHALNWMPLLFDFGAIAEHDSSSLEKWTLDGDYVYNNLGQSKTVQVVQDSDEIFMASWAPVSDRPRNLSARYLQLGGALETMLRALSDAQKGLVFQDAFYSGYFDPLKQRIFFLPVYWHADELNQHWEDAEKRAQALLRRFVWPPGTARKKSPIYLRLWLYVFLIVPLRIASIAKDFWEHRDAVGCRLGQMVRGDRNAWRRAANRVRLTCGRIIAKGY